MLYLKNRFPNGHQVVVFLCNALQLKAQKITCIVQSNDQRAVM